MSKSKLRKTILAGLIAEILLPGYLLAQTNTPDPQSNDEKAKATASAQKKAKEGETSSVIVTGIRASLASSQAIKKNSDAVVDVITAEDVGKFPDTNVAEALTRLPGVSLERERGEGRQISIRGMGPEYNTVLINGRSLTTDTGGRAFSFDVLPSSMIASATVYKTSLANLPEGGIGGTVDIATIRPLDFKGQNGKFNIAGTYNDKSKKTDGKVDAIYTLVNEARNMGVTALLSYSKQHIRTDEFQNPIVSGNAMLINAPANSVGLQPNVIEYRDNIAQPVAPTFLLGFQEKKRVTANITAQYKPNNDLVFTVDTMLSKLKQDERNYLIGSWFGDQYSGGVYINPKFTNGILTSFDVPGIEFINNNPALKGQDKLGRYWARANEDGYSTNNRDLKMGVFGFNTKWKINSDWKMDADISTSKTTSNEFNPTVNMQYSVKVGQTYNWNLGTIPSFVNNTDVTNGALWEAGNLHLRNVDKDDKWTDAHVKFSWTKEFGYFKGAEFGLGQNKRTNEYQKYNVFAPGAYKNKRYVVPSNLLANLEVGNFLGGMANAPQSFAYIANLNDYINWLHQPSSLTQVNTTNWNQSKLPSGVNINNVLPFQQSTLPELKWSVSEKVTNAFAHARFEGEGWDMLAGARIVNVKTTSGGFTRPVTNVQIDPVNLVSYIFTYGDPQMVYAENDYTDVLPSANFRYNLANDLILRLGVSKTVTRPTMDQMRFDEKPSGKVGSAKISYGGNPYLKPMRSTNLDASLEWYVNKSTSLAFAVYQRNLTDFIQSSTGTTTTAWAAPGDIVTYTKPDNVSDSKIRGYEIDARYVFEPSSMFAGFGATANISSLKQTGLPTTATCNGTPGLSPRTYNISGFYENEKFSARLSLNGRNAYVKACNGDGGNEPTWRDKYNQIDASVTYKFTPTISGFFNAVNLNNQDPREYSRYAERLSRYQVNGRRFDLGVSVGF